VGSNHSAREIFRSGYRSGSRIGKVRDCSLVKRVCLFRLGQDRGFGGSPAANLGSGPNRRRHDTSRVQTHSGGESPGLGFNDVALRIREPCALSGSSRGATQDLSTNSFFVVKRPDSQSRRRGIARLTSANSGRHSLLTAPIPGPKVAF
jgi:hypothetical protein